MLSILIMPVKVTVLNFGGCVWLSVKLQAGKLIIVDPLTFTLVKDCKELALLL